MLLTFIWTLPDSHLTCTVDTGLTRVFLGGAISAFSETIVSVYNSRPFMTPTLTPTLPLRFVPWCLVDNKSCDVVLVGGE